MCVFCKEIYNIRLLQSTLQYLRILLNILSRECLVNAVDLTSCDFTDKHSGNCRLLFFTEIMLRKEIGKFDSTVKTAFRFKHIIQLGVFAVTLRSRLIEIGIDK